MDSFEILARVAQRYFLRMKSIAFDDATGSTGHAAVKSMIRV
jgi:hypothetical protein